MSAQRKRQRLITASLAALVLFTWPGDSAADAEVSPSLAHSNSLVLKVADRNQAADVLIARTEALGGYFAARTEQMVELKIPVAAKPELLALIDTLGVTLDRRESATDLGMALEEQRTRLASRSAVLERYFAVLDSAGPREVVAVEREMTRLVQEIEVLKGNIQLHEHQLAFADVVVNFQFRDRQPPARDGHSSFKWLGTINLTDLQADFDRDN